MIDDDVDREPIDIAADAVHQVIAYEDFFKLLCKKHRRDGYEDIAHHRSLMMERILTYMSDASIFGQSSNPAWWECSNCGLLHHERNPNGKAYPPEECPVCQGKQSAFIKHHELGGW